MKGLLLKDWYMAKSYCRSYFLIILVFGAVSVFTPKGWFAFFPVLLASLFPVTLISYDERFKWQNYADILPCRRRKIVSAKYIFMLLCVAAAVCVTAGAFTIYSFMHEDFQLFSVLQFAGLSLFFGIVPASLILPFIFKLGAEKGRVIYMGVFGLSFACFSFVFLFSTSSEVLFRITDWIYLLIAAGTLIILVLSWLISVKLYENRDL